MNLEECRVFVTHLSGYGDDCFTDQDVEQDAKNLHLLILAEIERCAKVADSESDECGWTCDCGEKHSMNIAVKIRSGE